jgi:hypothetical protein
MADKIQYTSAQVAGQLNTDAKVLRRFLRATPEWSNPGSGGRYSFSSADVKAIKRQFPAWLEGQGTPTARKPRKAARVTATPSGAKVATGLGVLPRVDTSESPEVWDGPLPTAVEVRVEGAARAARLDQRLRATGHHLSQWTPERLAKAV